jgi:predicted kinase
MTRLAPTAARPWWLAAALVACTHPCEDLADRVCARAGGDAAVCKKLRSVAVSDRPADRPACEAGQVFLDELEKH